MSDFQNQAPRQMVDISSLGITCAKCGVAITELPFEPTKREDGTYGRLYCRECNRDRIRNRKRRFGQDDNFRQ